MPPGEKKIVGIVRDKDIITIAIRNKKECG